MTNLPVTNLSVFFDQATGQNTLSLRATDGSTAQYVLDIDPVKLIDTLEGLSAGVQISAERYRRLHIDTFLAITESIAAMDDDPRVVTPFGWIQTGEDSIPATAAEIAAAISSITVSVSEFDNGYFPSGLLSTEMLTTEDPGSVITIGAGNYKIIPALYDAVLYPALRELFGDYRYEPDWQVTLYRDPTAEQVRQRDDQ